MEKKLSHEEFVRLAIQKLRTGNYRGIHSVYSGFNEAFKIYFGGENPVEVTTPIGRSRENLPQARQARRHALLPRRRSAGHPGRNGPQKNGAGLIGRIFNHQKRID